MKPVRASFPSSDFNQELHQPTLIYLLGGTCQKGGDVAESLTPARRPTIVAVSVAAAFFMTTLAFLHVNAPSWSTEIVSSASYTSYSYDTQHDMIIDSQGNPNIATIDYYLRFIKRTDGVWDITNLKSGASDYRGVSITLDSQDYACISTGLYREDYYGSDHGHLTIATNRNGDWTVEDIPMDYYYLSSGVAVDSDKKIHVLCSGYERIVNETTHECEYSAGHLLHIYETSEGWGQSEIFAPAENTEIFIQSFKIGKENSLHALLENEVHASCESSYPLVLRNFDYVSHLSGDWTREIATSTDLESLHMDWHTRVSMAIDDNGKAHICRYIWNNTTASYSIAYVTNKNGAWSLSNLSYAGNWEPSSCSIDLDSTGAVHIAYYAHCFDHNVSRIPATISNHTERYLTDSGGSWRQEIFDDRGGGSDNTKMMCLAIGSDDVVHISYLANVLRETGGSDYKILYTTPAERTGALEDALINASAYAFAFSLIVGVIVVIVVFVYLPRRERKRISNQGEGE